MTDPARHTHTPDSASHGTEDQPSYRVVWLTVIIGVSLTLIATLAVYRWEYRAAAERTNLEFYSAAIDRLEAIRRDILLDLEVVQAVQSLFRSSHSVKRDEFRVFAKTLLDKRPGLGALAWIPKVTQAQRSAYEKERRHDMPGFRITAIAHGGERRRAASNTYFPVELLESGGSQTLAPGMDLASDPAAHDALEAARDNGRLVATRPLDLTDATATPDDLLVFAPLYDSAAELATEAARRSHVSGFIVAVFSVSRLVDGALAGRASRGIDLWVFDESSENKALVHWRPSPEAERPPLDGAREPKRARTHLTESVSMGGRSWALVAAPAPGQFVPDASNAHWVTFLGGLALTVLLAAYLSTVVRTAAARIRTEYQLRRLNRAHAVLSSCNGALARAQGESELLTTFCENLVSIGGYRMAWIGFLDKGGHDILCPVAQAGAVEEYTGRLRFDCRETTCEEVEPVIRAVRSARPVLVQDVSAQPSTARWHSEAQARGYGSVIALPLASGGARIGALAIYAAETYAFDPDEAILLDELAGDLAFGVTSFRNRAERDRAQVGLRLRERAIESSLDAIMLTDFRQPDCPIVYVNPAFTRITGYTREEVMGRNPAFLQGEDREQPELQEIRAAIRYMRHGVALLRNYRKDGSPFWNELHVAPVRDESNEVTHFVGIINDVTERVRYQQDLEHQANHDSLTGLANRNLLQDRIDQALRQGDRHDDMVGVLMLDLDRFKNVNDSLGHEAGDRLLQAVAGRLNDCVRSGDTVARQGGDEFVIVLPEVHSANDMTAIVHRALEAISRPIHLDEHEVVITACIGGSVYPRDGDSTETLLKNADAAMYRAKAHGPNTFRFYQASMNASALERLTLERHLRRALEREEFELHYQPQAELRSGRIVGMEALVRWRTADGNLVPPSEFIPLAEETGLIVRLGEWVLSEACRQARAWQKRGLSPFRVAVNVSARQFRQPGLFETIARVLRSSGLASHHLELELTETLLMDDPEHVIRALHQLKALGVQLTLDDFGTGYSSLGYLKRFPFGRVKIDRSFVRNIPEDNEDAAIALTVIAMAHSMKLKATAEGVETEAQIHYLREHGCDEFQGYHLAPPLPAREAVRFLRKAVSPSPAPRRAAG
jgi:diguanylate cyclase (GGDEF)-like protein/PAS domain S-box-containing protein